MSSTIRVVGLLGFAALVGPLRPAAVAAQTRAIVLEFSGGRDGAQARRAVVQGLEGVVTVVPLADAEAAARQARASLATPEGLAAAARATDARVFVSGGVRGRGRRARTTIRITDATGRVLATAESGPPFGRIGQRSVGEDASLAMQQALSQLVEEREPRNAWGSGSATVRGGRDSYRGAYARGGAMDEAERDARDGEGGPAARRRGDGSQPPLLRVLAGLDLRTRSATIALADGGTRGYDAGLYPEVMLALWLHPLASSDDVARGLYLALEAGHSVGLSSALPGSTDTIGSSSFRIFGALGWSFDVGGVLALGPEVGGAFDAFSIDANTVFASSGYGLLRLGAFVRVRVLDDALGLGLSGGYRAVLGFGELGTAFGAGGGGSGFDVRVDLGGALDLGLTYALRVGYERMGLRFERGAGTLGEATDGSDAAVRIQALLGWSFRSRRDPAQSARTSDAGRHGALALGLAPP
jgi:hypothetical protein